MCLDCRRDFLMRCPCCNGTLKVAADGLFCSDCGYYRRTERERSVVENMTEVRKIGEPE